MLSKAQSDILYVKHEIAKTQRIIANAMILPHSQNDIAKDSMKSVVVQILPKGTGILAKGTADTGKRYCGMLPKILEIQPKKYCGYCQKVLRNTAKRYCGILLKGTADYCQKLLGIII